MYAPNPSPDETNLKRDFDHNEEGKAAPLVLWLGEDSPVWFDAPEEDRNKPDDDDGWED